MTALWDTGRGQRFTFRFVLLGHHCSKLMHKTITEAQQTAVQLSDHTVFYISVRSEQRHSRWNGSSWSANTPERCHWLRSHLHLPEKGNVSSQQHRKSQTWTNWQGLSGKKWVSAKTVIIINGKEVKLISFSAPAVIGGAGGTAVRWKLKLQFF